MQKQYMVGQATFAEVEELIKFSQQFLPEASFDKDQITSYLKLLISNQHSVFIARDSSRKVAGVLLALSNGVDWRTGQKIVIEQGVYILNEIERIDICKALYKRLHEWALSLGAVKILAEAGVMNKSVVAEEDYKKFGFKTIGQVMEREVNQYV